MQYIIYKSLFDLDSLKQNFKTTNNIYMNSVGYKKKYILRYIKLYEKGIEDAKNRKAKAPEIATKEDERKAKLYRAGSKSIKFLIAIPLGALAAVAGSNTMIIDTNDYYLDPRVYITKKDFDNVIKELTSCKKYLENELKIYESSYNNGKVMYESLFDFELE